MPYRFFNIPLMHPEEAEAALNEFLHSHRVIDEEWRFLDAGKDSCWAAKVEYVAGAASGRPATKSDKIDYQTVLSEPEFEVFKKMRDLRKSLAERDGIPLYGVFKNDQFAAMIRSRMTTLAAIGTLEGVGDAKLGKYGPPFVKLLEAEIPSLVSGEKEGASDGAT